MKKILALLLALTLTLSAGLLYASAESDAGLKLGLDITVSLSNSRDAADTDGLAQIDATVVAVLADADGRIVNVFIDEAQTKLPFTATGKLGADFPTQPRTKLELGAGYGMSAVSKVGEWDQQIQGLRAYVLGKTAAEVQGIAVDAATRPTGADLTAGCTMSVGTYISGIVAALGKAVPTAAAATDTLGVGIVTGTDRSAESQAGSDGLCEAYSYYAVVTVNAAGVVTDCLLDSTQGTVRFDATGRITTDLSAAVQTKQAIGEGYGMRAASSIGKEWFEQADAFAAYAVGKTADQLNGIAMDTAGKATDVDLVAGVTLPVGPFKASVLKAVANAR